MKYTPHDYQLRAIDFLLKNHSAGLFLSMGLGKSSIVATALQQAGRFPILIVGPKRVVTDSWPAELSKWDHLTLRYSVVSGNVRARQRALATPADIYLINYESLVWLLEEYYDTEFPYKTIVFDESSRMKSHSAKRFKAMRKLLTKNRSIGVYLLSGTPAPNGLLDLWSQVFLLDRGERLGKAFTHYRGRYFQGDYNGWNFKPYPDSQRKIEDKLKDICLSMSAEDYLTLPDRIDNRIPVTLPATALTAYKALEQDFLIELVGMEVIAQSAATLSNKLLQACNGHFYSETGETIELHSAKLDALEDIIEEAAGAPVLVVYQYKADLARIQQRFHQAESLKDGTIERWNAGEVPMLCIQPASAGMGLNLQAGGNIMVWFGLTWNLEHYQQTCARLHRQGQDKPTFIHHIIAQNTIDERVMEVLEGKATIQQALMTALKESQ